MVRRGLIEPASLWATVRRAVAAALLFALAATAAAQAAPAPAPVAAQALVNKAPPSFVTRADAQTVFPILGSASDYKMGYGGALYLEYPIFPFLSPFARVGGSYAPLRAASGIVFAEGKAGLALSIRPTDRFVIRLEGMGGLASVTGEALKGTPMEGGKTAYAAGARLGAGFRIHPAVTIYASGGFDAYLGTEEPFYTAATAGISASFQVGGFNTDASKSRVRIRSVKTEAVFPVFYSYYDENAFGSVQVLNGEDSDIENVKVSFVVGRYMDRPKVCASFPLVAKGATVQAPLTALFNDAVLALTEGTTVRGEISVEYTRLGSSRVVSEPVEMRMHHRNAMNWLDDRRAAAFASPKDPASLWFSRFVSGIVRERLRGDVDRNLQYAIGLFEAERLFGLNYVIDPASSYTASAANEATVDYLQFPHQTLFYRGGDCDDLSILFASLLQSMNIETAFLTIPGHIYMAFALEMSEAQARAEFYDPGLLIFKDGKAWAPVEITMVKEGFVKAWRVGAKEWQDNVKTGSAAMFPLADAWKTYPSVGVPDVNPRLNLPDEVEVAQAFDMSLDRYVARDIETKVAEVKSTFSGKSAAVSANDLGVLYGRYGMFKEAWKELTASAKGGYAPAWINLANVAFLRKDYKLALEYYEYSRKIDPADPSGVLGIARSYYELERFDESDKAYAELRILSPELALKYSYLASMVGGEGRAWSMSERLSSANWAGEAVPAAQAAPVKIALAPVASAPAAPAPIAPVAPAPIEPAPIASVAAAPAPPAPVVPAEPAPIEPAPIDSVAAAPAPVAPVEPVPVAPTAPVAAPLIAEAAPAVKDIGERAAAVDAERLVAEAEAEDAKAAALAAAAKEAAAKEAAAKEVAAKDAAAKEAAAKEAAAKDAAAKEAAAKEAAGKAAKEAAAKLAAAVVAAAPPPPSISEELPEDRELAAKQAAAVASGKKIVALPTPIPLPSAVIGVAQAPKPVTAPVVAAPVQAPVAVAPAPVVSAPAPVVAAPAPVVAVPAPVAAAPAPVVAAPAPVVAEVAPVVAALAPVVAAPVPVVAEAALAPVVAAPAPVVTAPAPVVSAPAPVVSAPAPVMAEAAPVVAAPAPVVVAPAPVVAEAAPVIAALAPVVAEAAPVVAEPAPAPVVVEAASVVAAPAPVVAEAAPVEAAPAPVVAEAAPIIEAPALAAAPAAPEEPEPVGASDIAPAPPAVTIAVGFASGKPATGTWTLAANKAAQLDPAQYYGKLAMTIQQGSGLFSYSFKAKSTGYKWVGLGIHVYARAVKTHKGYGEGESILVWFTSDPVHYPDAATRLQVYRSLRDTYMEDMIGETLIPDSIFDLHDYRVDVDPATGTLLVLVDGVERFKLTDLKDFSPATTVALRALDKAEFSDFRVDATR